MLRLDAQVLLHHGGVGGEGIGRDFWLHAGIIGRVRDPYRHRAVTRNWSREPADNIEALTARNVVPLRAV
jgi:hypothetical protein